MPLKPLPEGQRNAINAKISEFTTKAEELKAEYLRVVADGKNPPMDHDRLDRIAADRMAALREADRWRRALMGVE